MRDDVIDRMVWEVLLAAGTLYSLWFAFKAWRDGRAVEDTPTSRVRSAAQGYVELDGRGILPPGVDIRAPLTRLPCTWWSFKIEQADSGRRSRSWTVVERGSSATPFALDDGTGTCLIDPRGAQVFGAHKTVWYGRTRRPDVRIPDGQSLLEKAFDVFIRGDFRYTELRLGVDAPLYAIGTFRSVGGVAGADTEAAVTALLRQWKRDQPALLQRFDTDHDGFLSEREWDAARAEALAQVQREALQRPVAPTINVLQHPCDDRSFLLAQCDAAALARRFRWRFLGGVTGFVGGAALLAWTWQQR
jgi:hypothetical protein